MSIVPHLPTACYVSSTAISTLKRKSLGGCPIPTKKNPSRYPLCFILPDDKSQKLFVSRGKKEHAIEVPGEINAMDVISYNGLQVIVASPTKSSLPAVFAALGQHLRQDADIVTFNPALITRVLKATPGTCHRLELCNYVESKLRTIQLHFPNLRIDSTNTPNILTSKKFYVLSCSSWAKGEMTGDGLARFEIEPHAFEHFVQNKWTLHHVAVCIGNPETIRSEDFIQAAFDLSIGKLVTGAYEVLRHLTTTSRGVVSKAIHLASDIVVPESILTSRDDLTNPDRVLPYPRNAETLERNQKVISDFFILRIHPHLEPRKIKPFALLLFDGDKQKYGECCQALEPTDESDELLCQIFLEYKSIAGNDIDFSKLKQVFNKMGNKELLDMCDHFYIEHSFSFRVHHVDCNH